MILPLAAFIAPVSTGAIVFGFGFVDTQHPAVQVTTVESGNGLFSVTIIVHFHESKTSGMSGLPVSNDVHPTHHAVGLKDSSNGAFGSVEAKVSYINIFHVIFFPNLQSSECGQDSRGNRLREAWTSGTVKLQ